MEGYHICDAALARWTQPLTWELRDSYDRNCQLTLCKGIIIILTDETDLHCIASAGYIIQAVHTVHGFKELCRVRTTDCRFMKIANNDIVHSHAYCIHIKSFCKVKTTDWIYTCVWFVYTRIIPKVIITLWRNLKCKGEWRREHAGVGILLEDEVALGFLYEAMEVA